ncbi:uncharacterized protein LOC588819 [Strongylocentrotus purpuratus]|uniref:Amidase domain-containing protein n=1 Tax=Strongylocentrotus purpuratus TaxID=7668 RepID=A0A7M7ST65_STRPU|nr:uncharacterized protein LOC588819 [Strongylocentrotus purpuratus]XP_030829317.1 uncharacterized protein LOC588819 [Strongylocentrotus purpuratus]XP_030829318.1 uncharacterized protein LOC588819 [Strongylocentrotus purpuratus]
MMMGCYALEGYVPDFDATVVTRVLDEGGVILGKATCEDLCYSANSHTSAKGPVSNPLNKQHCAGGSSSGCAVLVACNEVDMAIGGDQGGSIRVPASWCGVVGLKPTFGLVPYTGAACNEYTVDHVGPIARTVEGCALLLEVIAGYDDGRDARQQCNVEVPNYLKNLKNAPTKPLRIAVLKEGFGHEISDPEVDKLIRHTISRFAASSGATVEDVSIPLHKMSVALCVSILAVEGVDCLFTSGCAGLNHTGYYPTSMMSGVGARLKANMTKLAPCHKARLLLGNYLKKNYCAVYGKAQNLRRLLTKGYDDVLEKFDVVAMPTTPFTAPKLPTQADWMKEILGHDTDMTWNLKAGNLTGHPSISINAGVVEGLPVGLLLTGKKFQELELLQAAYAFEKFLSSSVSE